MHSPYRMAWSGPAIRPVSVHSCKFTIRAVTNEKQRKTELTQELDDSSKQIKVGLIIEHLSKLAYRPTLMGHAISSIYFAPNNDF